MYKKDKNWETFDDLDKSEWDSDSNDETESDIDNDDMKNNLLKVF